jgi:hypothetical protein
MEYKTFHITIEGKEIEVTDVPFHDGKVLDSDYERAEKLAGMASDVEDPKISFNQKTISETFKDIREIIQKNLKKYTLEERKSIAKQVMDDYRAGKS